MVESDVALAERERANRSFDGAPAVAAGALLER
jgi:hypothetical protein